MDRDMKLLRRFCLVMVFFFALTMPVMAWDEFDHVWGPWRVIVQPTCTHAGLEERTCVNCGAKDKRPLPAPGHKWGPWIVVRQATSDHKGLKERTCSRCGLIEKRSIPQLPPAPAPAPTKPAVPPKPPSPPHVAINTQDVVFSGLNLSFLLVFSVLIWWDLLVLRWLKRKKREFLEKGGA